MVAEAFWGKWLRGPEIFYPPFLLFVEDIVSVRRWTESQQKIAVIKQPSSAHLLQPGIYFSNNMISKCQNDFSFPCMQCANEGPSESEVQLIQDNVKLFKGTADRVRIIPLQTSSLYLLCRPHIQLVAAGLMLQQLTYFPHIDDLTMGGKLIL